MSFIIKKHKYPILANVIQKVHRTSRAKSILCINDIMSEKDAIVASSITLK